MPCHRRGVGLPPAVNAEHRHPDLNQPQQGAQADRQPVRPRGCSRQSGRMPHSSRRRPQQCPPTGPRVHRPGSGCRNWWQGRRWRGLDATPPAETSASPRPVAGHSAPVAEGEGVVPTRLDARHDHRHEKRLLKRKVEQGHQQCGGQQLNHHARGADKPEADRPPRQQPQGRGVNQEDHEVQNGEVELELPETRLKLSGVPPPAGGRGWGPES